MLFLLACSAGTESIAVDTAAQFCDEAPLVTYENFGAGFVTENCQGCHASTTANHYGAPENVTFDDATSCWNWKDRILARAGAEDPTMPPNGGVTEEDRIRLRWWLLCAPEGS